MIFLYRIRFVSTGHSVAKASDDRSDARTTYAASAYSPSIYNASPAINEPAHALRQHHTHTQPHTTQIINRVIIVCISISVEVV